MRYTKYITLIVFVLLIFSIPFFKFLDENVKADDPPDDPFNNTNDLGWELLDNGSVIRAWNSRDSYYFNNSNGVQFSNHWNEYWSTNVLMIGFYLDGSWNLLYRTDELSGFNRDFEGETDVFMNLTLWKDLTFGGYNFRLALRYHLGVNDSDLTIIPYIKNLGISIPFDIGFGWELKNIQVANTIVNDNIRVNDSSYLLNQSLDKSYTNLSHRYNYTIMEMDSEGNWTGNYTQKYQTVYNTRFTIFDDTKSIREILYMRWDKNLTYLLQVKSRDRQYNAPVTLFIKIGTLGVGQEKSTLLGWYDATGDYPTIRDDWTQAREDDSNEAVVITKPSGTVENDLLVAFVSSDGVEDFASPSGWTGIANVASDACSLGAFYKVATSSEPSDYTFTWGSSEDALGSIIRITGADTTSPIHVNTTAFESATGQPVIAPDITTSVDNCVILRVHTLDDNDEGNDYDDYPVGHIGVFAKDGGTTSSSVAYENLSGQGSAGTAQWTFTNNEEFVTFSIAVAPASATPPTLSGESPVNSSTGIAVTPTLYVVCTDINNETMRAIWRSNSTDGVTWVTFASNTSIATGTNITQTNNNFSEGSEIYYWSVNLTDDYSDTSWTNATYHFSTVLSIPEIQIVQYSNGSTGVSTTPTMQVKPWDNGTYAEDMTVKWYESLINPLGFVEYNTTGQTLSSSICALTSVTGSGHNYIQGYEITTNYPGYADNITIWFNTLNDDLDVRCSIYNIDGTDVTTRIAYTEGKTILNAQDNTKITFDFITRPFLDNNTNYVLFAEAIECIDISNTIKAESLIIVYTKNQECPYVELTDSPMTGESRSSGPAPYIILNMTPNYQFVQTNNSVSSGDTASWIYTNASSESTQYWWKFVVNNSQQTNGSDDWYTFTTAAGEVVNSVPTSSNEAPTNNTNIDWTGNVRTYSVVSDTDSDTINVSWWHNSSGSWEQYGVGNTSVSSGTNISQENANFSTADTHYYWWIIGNDGEGGEFNNSFKFIINANNSAPTFANEAPTNGSTGVSLQKECYVVCNDADGGDTLTVDFFSNESDGSTWIWQSGNTSVSPGDNISFTFTNADTHITKYWWQVWINDGTVNVSDTYGFIASPPAPFVNNASNASFPVPNNHSVDISRQPVCNASVIDQDGNSSTCDFYTSPDGVAWTWVQTNSSVLNESISFNYTGATSFNTKYYWNITVNDGLDNVSFFFDFTTISNSVPTFADEAPTNESTGVSLTPKCYVVCNDGNSGDTLTVDFSDNSTGSYIWRDGWTTQTPGTNLSFNFTQASVVSTEYWWRVYSNDGTDNSSDTYHFTTRDAHTPDAPASFTATTVNRTKIDLSWTDDTEAESTLIEWNNAEDGTWNIGDHTELYNDTAETYSHTGLPPATAYYYKAWSWNSTDNVWSTGSTSDALTDFNLNTTFSWEVPTNESTGQSLSLTWNLTIEDPEGDWFNWTLECNNTQTNDADYEHNGSKELSISGLVHSTQYTVWVNVSDEFDNETREWYLFTTSPPAPFVNNASNASFPVPNNHSVDISPQVVCNATIIDQDGNSSTCDFFTSPDGSAWTWVQTNSSVLNESIQFNYTSATSFNTKYYWNITVNDGLDNVSFFFDFTTHIAPDNTIPVITINFAGNLTDSGGPYWRPPGESVQLAGVFSDGYHTNASKQSENFTYINLTIAEPESDIDNVWLNWLNETTWTNWTAPFINRTGGFWDINSSHYFDTYGGYNYSFDIVANNSAGGSNWTAWNKTGTGGTGANRNPQTRRYIQLNCTPESIEYTPYYFNAEPYTAFDGSKYDRLKHDQGIDGGQDDTGVLRSDIPTDTVIAKECSAYTLWWFDEDICPPSFTITNAYVHVWKSSNLTGVSQFKLEDSREREDIVGDWQAFTSNRSTIYYDSEGPVYNDTYFLWTELYERSFDRTDNNIHQSVVIFYDWTLLSTISNRSFMSFVVFNIPDDIWDGTDNITDTDSDGLSDHMELNITYGYSTNPWLSDTDNDGVNDYVEAILTGSDPNNYTDTEGEFIWIDITNNSWSLGNVVMNSQIYTNETAITFICDMDNTTVDTDLKLQITSDGADWTAATSGNGVDTDTYRLNASIDTWSNENQILTASATTISSNIVAGQNETFDLRFDAPTASTTGTQQTTTITATLVKH